MQASGSLPPVTSADADSKIPLSSWYALALLFLVNMFAYADRMALAMLQEQIKAELHTTDAQMGLLLGLAFALFYSTLGIPLARLADRMSRPKLLAACLFAWSAMTAVSGLCRNFTQLFIARMGVGVGEAGCVPPAHSLIGELFPRDKRALGVGIFQSGAVVGLSAGMLVIGILGEHFGWRVAFQVIGLTGLPLALLMLLTLRDPRSAQVVEETRESARQALGALLRRRAFVHLLLAYSVGSICTFGIIQWVPSFLMRSFGMGMVEVGAWSGLASLISSVSGLLLGGVLVAWLVKRDARWELWLPAITMGASVPMFVLMCLSPEAWMAISMKMLANFFGAVGSGVALALFLSALLGQGLGPFLIGMFSDLLAPTFGQESLRYALLISCSMLVWSVVHYMLSARTSRRDQVD
jgi:predicted MFS family arabinose efflux permease